VEEETSNKDLFDEAENVSPEQVSDETPKENTSNALIEEDLDLNFSDETQQEREEKHGKHTPADGRVLTIESVEVVKPKIIKEIDGVKTRIKPDIEKGKEFYKTKLRVKFVEDNIVAYYSNIRLWVNEGKISPDVRIWRDGFNKVSELFRKALLAKNPGKFKLEDRTINERVCNVVTKETKDVFDAISKITSDKEILDFMVGKKVKIKLSEGEYESRHWFRNDIVSFEN